MGCSTGSITNTKTEDKTEVTSEPEFDTALGHKKFAAAAFNRTWDFIELKSRTDEEVRQMLDAAHASSWHWRHRDDATPKNRSIADWQLSRVWPSRHQFALEIQVQTCKEITS